MTLLSLVSLVCQTEHSLRCLGSWDEDRFTFVVAAEEGKSPQYVMVSKDSSNLYLISDIYIYIYIYKYKCINIYIYNVTPVRTANFSLCARSKSEGIKSRRQRCATVVVYLIMVYPNIGLRIRLYPIIMFWFLH